MRLHERLKSLIEAKTNEANRFKTLEDGSKIAAQTWRSYYKRGLKPTGDLVEAASLMWPEHAFWLATGIDDPQNGHYQPSYDQKNQAAIEYFKLKIALLSKNFYKIDWSKYCEFTGDLSEYRTPHTRYIDRVDSNGFYKNEEYETAFDDGALLKWLKFPDDLKEIVEINDVREHTEMLKSIRNKATDESMFNQVFEHVKSKGYRLKEPYLTQFLKFKMLRVD